MFWAHSGHRLDCSTAESAVSISRKVEFGENGHAPDQTIRHSKQNSCEQVGTTVRSTMGCKQMVHWSSSTSSSASSSFSAFGEMDSSLMSIDDDNSAMQKRARDGACRAYITRVPNTAQCGFSLRRSHTSPGGFPLACYLQNKTRYSRLGNSKSFTRCYSHSTSAQRTSPDLRATIPTSPVTVPTPDRCFIASRPCGQFHGCSVVPI